MSTSASTLSYFHCALITGGSGGIGYAMAEHLIKAGKKVIIAGRTESKLQSAAKSLGHGTHYYTLDTGEIAAIPAFISKVTAEHPELDCLINNAGVQRPLDANTMSAEEFLSKGDNEININIRGPMHLALGMLNHLKQKKSAAIINVSSVLGYIPTSVINPVYNGTKAWTHFFTMNLRTQLAQADAHIKVVEIAPPTVATDLHRERSDPDDNKKSKNKAALEVPEFMEFVSKGFESGKETIGAGTSEAVVERWYNEFGGDYSKAAGGK